MTEDWIIGFVWGIGTISDARLYIRYHDRELLQTIAETINTRSRPFSPTVGKIGLRIRLDHPFCQKLLQLGWTGRMDKSRLYPTGEIDHIEFIRGYCYTKSVVDTWKRKTRKGDVIRSPRLRIYGSQDIVYHIDQYFAKNIGTTPKKPALHTTKQGDCWVIYYLSIKEIPVLVSILELSQKSIQKQ
ncbi:hypothetical protein ALO_12461 [Acetonema longum DSM 6540]|uniref:DOD-type homing endonuclease domain-containing protein n=2 Tax=Acetonema TaxID=2373 RepID=F7NK79_9FIRM|nr:hypothetical protein ALO_12461 [Acetonema longum DSM 6540]